MSHKESHKNKNLEAFDYNSILPAEKIIICSLCLLHLNTTLKYIHYFISAGRGERKIFESADVKRKATTQKQIDLPLQS